MPPTSRSDVLIIGAGIVGAATARALSLRTHARVHLIEAEPALARHQTGRNSGVIHSGLYYRPDSMKARTCVRGREALYRYLADKGIPHERCGKLVVATTDAELPRLDELARRGNANGLLGLERVGPERAREIEPHVDCLQGLFVPETGVVDFSEVLSAYVEDLIAAGGALTLNARALSARRDGDGGDWIVETRAGAFRAGAVVCCAGLQSDRVARRFGARPGLRIVPFRGQYYDVSPARAELVRHLIYPVPDPRFPFLGVHFTRAVDGHVHAGPNAALAWRRGGYGRVAFSARDALSTLGFPGFWRMAGRLWRMALHEMVQTWSRRAFTAALRRLIPEISARDTARGTYGVRAQAVGRDGRLLDDFAIVEGPGSLHVLNAPSPAATASLAIGDDIAARAVTAFGLRARASEEP
jgi:(S)-2-hydroxyglutarate dehydrogenase